MIRVTRLMVYDFRTVGEMERHMNHSFVPFDGLKILDSIDSEYNHTHTTIRSTTIVEYDALKVTNDSN